MCCLAMLMLLSALLALVISLITRRSCGSARVLTTRGIKPTGISGSWIVVTMTCLEHEQLSNGDPHAQSVVNILPGPKYLWK